MRYLLLIACLLLCSPSYGGECVNGSCRLGSRVANVTREVVQVPVNVTRRVVKGTANVVRGTARTVRNVVR